MIDPTAEQQTIIRAHRRQWLIGRADRIAGVPGHFDVRPIGEELFLHHDPQLRIEEDGSGILTLGLLIGDAQDTPAELRHRHSGRFVTIADGRLHLDATGSMAVFHAEQRGPVVCSSSIALIVQATDAPTLARKLEWVGKSMNWDPSPSCRALGFARLYTDQALDLVSGTPRQLPRPLLPLAGDLAVLLAEYLADYMRDLKRLGAPVFLPLTGGQDSRTLLAAALAEGLEFTAYTDLRGKRSKVDDHIARRLARRYGFRHVSHWPGPRDEQAVQQYARHTAGCEGDSIATQVANRFYHAFPPGAISLSGGVFEVGRVFYAKRLGSVDFSDAERAARDIAAVFLTDDSAVIGAVDKWIRYRQEHPIEGMSLIELFYLDQRLGAWASANRQAEDATGLTRLTPMNSWTAISILLSVPQDRRAETDLQATAMNLLVPGISTVEPINPKFPHNLRAKLGFRGRALLKGRPLLRI